MPAHFKKGLVDGVHQESSGTGHFVQKVTFEKMGVTRMHGPENSRFLLGQKPKVTLWYKIMNTRTFLKVSNNYIEKIGAMHATDRSARLYCNRACL